MPDAVEGKAASNLHLWMRLLTLCIIHLPLFVQPTLINRQRSRLG